MDKLIESEKTTCHIIRSEEGEVIGEFKYNWALAPSMFFEQHFNLNNETLKYLCNSTDEERESIKKQARIYFLQQELIRLQSTN